MQGCLCSVICVFSQNHGLATKGTGIELAILVYFFVEIGDACTPATREMNSCNLIGGYSLGELSEIFVQAATKKCLILIVF